MSQPQARNWCFTLNNYGDEDVNRLSHLVETNSHVKYIIFGRETASTGTKHLQGFITFSIAKRLSNVKKIIGKNPHVEIARNIQASIQYCKKENDFEEFGITSGGGQGKRNDVEAFKDAVKGGMLSLREIRDQHSDIYARYPRFCLEFIDDHYPRPSVEQFPLYPWQLSLKEKLEGPADRRKVIFVVDLIGNSGKSWFAHYMTKLLGEDKCQVLLPGRKADMAYALRMGISVLFLDAPRSKQGEFIQYDFLEDMKNGYVFSTKYQSRTTYFDPVHVVVNMNEEPDYTKLSIDRYEVIHLSKNEN